MAPLPPRCLPRCEFIFELRQALECVENRRLLFPTPNRRAPPRHLVGLWRGFASIIFLWVDPRNYFPMLMRC